MTTKYAIIQKLISPEYLPYFNQQAVVGCYVQVEYAHWQIHRVIQSSKSSAVNDGEYENAYVQPGHEQELKRYQEWLDAAKPYLPDWYKPGFRFEVESQLNELFSNITSELNTTIDQRRQQGVKCRPDTPLGAQQIALEKCRRWAMGIVMRLVWGEKSP